MNFSQNFLDALEDYSKLIKQENKGSNNNNDFSNNNEGDFVNYKALTKNEELALFREPNRTEYHFPGQNFTGPGTRVVSRVLDKIQPNNRTDAATLIHDVDYMIASNNSDALKADLMAMKNSDLDVAGAVTRWGLFLRSLLLPSKFYGGDKQVGLKLKQYIKNDTTYKQTFDKLGMSNILQAWQLLFLSLIKLYI